MILNNVYQYPRSVVEAAKAQIYRPLEDTLRVSELIDSPLVKRLTIEHWTKLEVDVDEIVYSSLFGTAWHEFLSQYEPDALVEKRWYAKLPNDERILTGQTDIFKANEGIIEDHKTQSAWAFVFGVPSWERQLNCYVYLIEKSGYKVNKMFINSFLRDWSKYEAMKGKNKDYPDHKFHKIECRIWPEADREKYLIDRLAVHSDPNYICSDEERWRRPTTWAVKKVGVKTAKRVLDTEVLAKKWIEDNQPKGDIFIEERKGGCIRCQEYCNARAVCPYKD